jgi:chromosome segregation ATPase
MEKQQAEGGFTANEMRTDYARSHVWPTHAHELERVRTADVVTLEDVLDLRARAIEAGDRRTADLLRRAATELTALQDKVADLRRMLREDAEALKLAQRELFDARKAIADATDGGAIL